MSAIATARPWSVRERTRCIAALSVTIVGVVGLLSAISAPMRGRLQGVLSVVPNLAPATAAVTLVFVSFALMVMARGLRSGHRAAWITTIGLLVTSVGLHLVHGTDPTTCVPPALAAAWLIARADAFPVVQSRRVLARSLLIGTGGLAVSVLVSVVMAALFDPVDLDASTRNALRHLTGLSSPPMGYGGRITSPVLLATGLCLLVWTLWSLLSPHRATRLPASQQRIDRERARSLVMTYGRSTLDFFALRDDKSWFFSGSSVIAYAVRAGVCVVSPDPIGPADERHEVWAEFMDHAEDHGWSVSVLGASEELLPLYEASGLKSIYLGDEAVIDCQEFTLEGRARRSIRQAHSRVARAGYTATFCDPLEIDETLAARLSELAGMCRQGAVERGFSMTLSRMFEPDDVGLLLSVARDADGVAQAYIQWVPCSGGWSLDVMRRNTDSTLTNGIIEFLIIESLLRFRSEGLTIAGLNFAVFRSIINGERDRWGARLARRALASTTSQTQIESLWRFNAKFDPRWQPRYAVVGTMDALAIQGVVMANAEGITELPVLGRFMKGM